MDPTIALAPYGVSLKGFWPTCAWNAVLRSSTRSPDRRPRWFPRVSHAAFDARSSRETFAAPRIALALLPGIRHNRDRAVLYGCFDRGLVLFRGQSLRGRCSASILDRH